MTINLSDNDPRVSYDVAAGVTQSSFAVSFEFFDNDDLNVYVDGVLKTLTTDYTVSGGDGSTGTVTISVTGASGGSKVVITRDIDLDRTTDFPSSGPFNIASLNTELDRFVAIAADLKDQADRALQLTDFDVAASLTLPEVDDRKGKTLAFNNTTGAVEAGPTISDVQSVSDAAADIQTLAHIEDGTDATDAIQTVAGISGNVTTVAGISANVTTVAGISSDVTAVAGDEADIGTVSTNISNVNTVAGISANVTTVAGISSDVTSVAGDATDIGTVATNIADVNTAASNITEIQNASTNAATATTKAAEAATSATTATTQATTATTQATNAATSATNAATSATNASTSETNAATSAAAAAASQTAAANSAAAAASAFDNFDDTYLGSKTSDPTVDNDGDPLTDGDLYFNTTANEMRVYDGANWIAATSAGNVSLLNYNYTATSGQTTFSGADDNAATLSYTAQNLIVTLNGIVLEDGTDYTATNGTSVVLTTGAATGDELNVVAFKSFTTADMVPASTGGTFSGNVTVSADLTVGSNALFVDESASNVGIGTSSPSSKMHLQNTSGGSEGYLKVTDAVHGGDVRFGMADGVDNDAIAGVWSNNNFRFYTNSAERLRINSSGNVGIGTSSPSAIFNVSGPASSPVVAELETANSNADITLQSASSGSVTRLRQNTNDFQVHTNGSERLRIDSSGNLLVGTTSGALGATNGVVINAESAWTTDNSSAVPIRIYNKGSSGTRYLMEFRSSGGAVGRITHNGTSTSYVTSSDYRLKTDAQPITGASARVQALNPVNFEWISSGERVDGFLAHEAQAVVPEAVTGTKDAVDADGNPEYQGIDQSKLVPLLTAALQEALTEIADLKARVTTLEG